MENERGFKVLAVVALLVAVVGVSVGFAAYTKNFNVVANNVQVSAAADQFTDSLTLTSTSGTVAGTVWTLPATTLSESNRSVEYTGTFTNSSDYNAYLTGVTMPQLAANACSFTTANSGDSSVLEAFCGLVNVTITFDSTAYDPVTQAAGLAQTYAAGDRSLFVPKKSDGTNGTKTVKVKISAGDADNTAIFPDANATIDLPQIQFSFSSIA